MITYIISLLRRNKLCIVCSKILYALLLFCKYSKYLVHRYWFSTIAFWPLPDDWEEFSFVSSQPSIIVIIIVTLVPVKSLDRHKYGSNAVIEVLTFKSIWEKTTKIFFSCFSLQIIFDDCHYFPSVFIHVFFLCGYCHISQDANTSKAFQSFYFYLILFTLFCDYCSSLFSEN